MGQVAYMNTLFLCLCSNYTYILQIYFYILYKLIFFIQFVKCGFGGSNFPTHVFPSMVGRPIIRSSAKVGDIEVKVRLSINN